MKRFAALLIVFAMLLCLLSVSVLAANQVSSPEPNPDDPGGIGEDEGGNGNGGAGNGSQVLSPQTGVTGSVVVVAVMMAIAMSYVSFKKILN